MPLPRSAYLHVTQLTDDNGVQTEGVNKVANYVWDTVGLAWIKSTGSGGSGGGKLQTLVDFPIENLDLQPFILQKSEDGNVYVYDLFGISNHYGGLGGGHYTAYAKNWKEDQWYSYDDSSCSRATPARIITDAAYNLFYRRRSAVDLNKIDYEEIRQTATLE